MKRKVVFRLMLTLLLISMLTLVFNIEQVSAIESPYLAVVPDTISDPTLTPGKNFTVSIYTDYTGSDVWGYQFTLIYNPLVLQGVNVTNGDLITTDKNPNATFIPGTFNNTAGTLSLTAAFFLMTEGLPTPTTSGSGILANVTFTVVSLGDSNITFGPETQLKAPTYNIVDMFTQYPAHIGHGYFSNGGTPYPDYIALNATYHTLLANYSDLLNDYSDLLDSYDLVAYLDSLNSTYYNLLGMHSQLQSDYNDLKSRYDALTADLGTTRNLSYIFIIATIVFIATSVYLAVRKPRVKTELKAT